MLDFVAARAAADSENSLVFCRGVQTGTLPGPGGVTPSRCCAGESGLRGHQALEQLIATTITPYLGRPGEVGHNAERQLWLLAVTHGLHRDYREEWHP